MRTFNRRNIAAGMLACVAYWDRASARDRELTCEEDEDGRDEREDCADGTYSSGSDGTGWKEAGEGRADPARKKRRQRTKKAG